MSETTVIRMARLPNVLVLVITAFFAMGGGLMFTSPDQSVLAAWIPLCCLTIPPLFYLSREVVRLRRKIDALETRMG